MKLQRFEFDVCDVIPANVQNSSSWFSLHIFVNFVGNLAYWKNGTQNPENTQDPNEDPGPYEGPGPYEDPGPYENPGS